MMINVFGCLTLWLTVKAGDDGRGKLQTCFMQLRSTDAT
jgi:hypothetical protein